jgi:thymidylate synthase (FAD)
MNVTYIWHVGSDASIAADARVSNARERQASNPEKDAALIRYLARGVTEAEFRSLLAEIVMCETADAAERLWRRIRDVQTHFAPFTHTSIKLHFDGVPLAIARQWWRSTVGVSTIEEATAWSEMSMRYVEASDIYRPSDWRAAAPNVKQGSSDQVVDDESFALVAEETFDQCAHAYERAFGAGICLEQARFLLPMATATRWIQTGSVLAFRRICKLRQDPHAQKEIRDLANQVEAIIEPLFPISWSHL